MVRSVVWAARHASAVDSAVSAHWVAGECSQSTGHYTATQCAGGVQQGPRLDSFQSSAVTTLEQTHSPSWSISSRDYQWLYQRCGETGVSRWWRGWWWRWVWPGCQRTVWWGSRAVSQVSGYKLCVVVPGLGSMHSTPESHCSAESVVTHCCTQLHKMVATPAPGPSTTSPAEKVKCFKAAKHNSNLQNILANYHCLQKYLWSFMESFN